MLAFRYKNSSSIIERLARNAEKRRTSPVCKSCEPHHSSSFAASSTPSCFCPHHVSFDRIPRVDFQLFICLFAACLRFSNLLTLRPTPAPDQGTQKRAIAGEMIRQIFIIAGYDD